MPPSLSTRLFQHLVPVAASCFLATVAHPAPPAPRPPSIVFVLADDLGYAELGCYGQKVIQTPRLDAMAREGVRFTQFYAGAPVCGPSRSVLMTGLNQGRTRVRGNRSDPARMALHEEDATVAQLLKAAGYRTAAFGKWGLGDFGAAASGLPRRHGFEHFFGYLNHFHAHNHFPAFLWRNEERFTLPNEVTPVGDHGGGVTEQPVLFADDLITDEVLQWITANQQGPFFIYWNPVLPHANNERTRLHGNGTEVPDLGPYAGTNWPEPDKGQAAMITRLDSYVGRLLDHLRRLGLDHTTLVVFTSDNGPHNESNHDLARFQPAAPFRGIKRDLTDGGIRVPFIAWWPGQIAPGGTSPHVGYFGDWFATTAALAGIPAPSGLDSISCLPSLLGTPGQQEHEFIYWEFHEGGFSQAALLEGRWKAIRLGRDDASLALYDLQSDPAEGQDLAAARPDLIARFEAYFKTARTPSPDWPTTR